MDDRQLLEAAARAAGMKDMKWSGPSGMVKMIDPSRPESTGSIGRAWNPLIDDGDALRLAVKLRIDVFKGIGFMCCETDLGTTSEPIGDDEMAACRQAIVRAAAALSQVEQGKAGR